MPRCLCTFRVFLFLLGGLLFPGSPKAQLNNLSFKHLTPQEGLTQGVINAVYTDTKGFVWMTGLDGVNRFDGIHCLANQEIAPGLGNPGSTYGILEDNTGDIWFGSSEGLIQFSYRDNRFTEHKIIPPQSADNSRHQTDRYFPMASDREHNLLVRGNNELTLLFNVRTRQARPYALPPMPGAAILGFYLPEGSPSMEKNLTWIVHEGDSIRVCKRSGLTGGDQEWKNKSLAWKGPIIPSIWMPGENTLFFYSKGRVHKYDLVTGIIGHSPEIRTESANIVFVPDASGRLWLSATMGGLQVLDTATMQVVSHLRFDPRHSSGISSNDVFAYIDRNQVLWVMAWGKGVDYTSLTEQRFTSFLTAEDAMKSGISNFVRGIAAAPNGDIYCSTQSGIIVLDAKLQFKSRLRNCDPVVAYPDISWQGRKLYFVTDAVLTPGLYEYDIASGLKRGLPFFGGKNDRRSVVPYQLGKTGNNELLVATLHGLWKLSGPAGRPEPLPGITPGMDITDPVVCSFEDASQQIYKCLNNLGFSVYRRSGTIYKEVFRFDKKVTVKHIVPLDDSLLWMGTTNGLYLFNARQLKWAGHYTQQDGLPNNVVYAVQPDEKNNLWLSTNRGLSYLDRSANTFSNFTVDDGLQANEFNTHVVMRTSDGRIIFGGVNGLTVVNPGVLHDRGMKPVLAITSVKTDSVLNPHPYNDSGATLLLHAGTNAFDMELTAMNFSNPAQYRIKYRLKGFDDEWREDSNPADIHFARLPPGEYVLEWQASTTRGDSNGEVKALTIIVQPYWWQTAGFKVMAIALFAGVFFGAIIFYFRFKLKRQREKLERQTAIQSERERITADLHDDMGATLSSMHIYGDLAQAAWDTHPQQSRDMVGRISEQSKELMARLSDIVWSLKSPKEEKNSFTLRLTNYTQDLLASKGIAVNYSIDEAVATLITHPLARKNLLLITKEAINNIAKYSGATKATIQLQRQEKNVRLLIGDNGKGFDPSCATRGNGLGNMDQRCRQLGGTCSIDARPGAGVTILCQFPLAIISHDG